MCTNNKKDLKLKKLNKTSEHLQQKPILNKKQQNSSTKQETELQLKILAIKKKN
ncbi:hypothetical protein HIC20_02285 [Buchnera aphidicola (Hormaphis cornu)]|nr:hypothetical protein HIC20_02285 [Buchnera aphidicola (Hormaphis cornu)]